MLLNKVANSCSLFFVSLCATLLIFFALFFAAFVAVLVTPTALFMGCSIMSSNAFANPVIDIFFLNRLFAIRADRLVGTPARGVRRLDRLCLVRRLVRLWDLCFAIIYYTNIKILKYLTRPIVSFALACEPFVLFGRYEPN